MHFQDRFNLYKNIRERYSVGKSPAESLTCSDNFWPIETVSIQIHWQHYLLENLNDLMF